MLICIVKRIKINKKRPGLAHFKNMTGLLVTNLAGPQLRVVGLLLPGDDVGRGPHVTSGTTLHLFQLISGADVMNKF